MRLAAVFAMLALLVSLAVRSVGVLPGPYSHLAVITASWAVLSTALYMILGEVMRWRSWREPLKLVMGFIAILYASGVVVGYGVNTSAPNTASSLTYTLLAIYMSFVARFAAIGLAAIILGPRAGAAYGVAISVTARIGYEELLRSLETQIAVMGLVVYEVVPALLEAFAAVAIARYGGLRPVLAYSMLLGLLVYIVPVLPLLDWRILVLAVAGLNATTTLYVLGQVDVLRRLSRYLPYRIRSVNSAWQIAFTVLVLSGALLALMHGYRGFIIASGSMEPTLSVGDIVLVAPLDGAPKIGEVVAYLAPSGEVVIHRVVDVLHDGQHTYIVTKGDSNTDPDPPVHLGAVIGRLVAHIPLLGIPLIALSAYTGGLYGLSMTLIAAYAMATALAARRRRSFSFQA